MCQVLVLESDKDRFRNIVTPFQSANSPARVIQKISYEEVISFFVSSEMSDHTVRCCIVNVDLIPEQGFSALKYAMDALRHSNPPAHFLAVTAETDNKILNGQLQHLTLNGDSLAIVHPDNVRDHLPYLVQVCSA